MYRKVASACGISQVIDRMVKRVSRETLTTAPLSNRSKVAHRALRSLQYLLKGQMTERPTETSGGSADLRCNPRGDTVPFRTADNTTKHVEQHRYPYPPDPAREPHRQPQSGDGAAKVES